jgi:hypothetical protein
MVVFLVGFMVFNATFNNISVISWLSVLLMEDLEKRNTLTSMTRDQAGIKRNNMGPAAQHH